MYDLVFPLIVQLIPFTVLFHVAVDLLMRNRMNRLHQLAAALLFSLSTIFLSSIVIIAVPWEANIPFILTMKYTFIFIAMALMNYYFAAVGRVVFPRGLRHATMLTPLIGVVVLFAFPDFVQVGIAIDGIWHVEKFGRGFYYLFIALSAQCLGFCALCVRLAYRHVNSRPALIRERNRIRILIRGVIFAMLFMVVSSLIRQLAVARGVYILHILPSYSVLIWAYFIHYSIVHSDVISTANQRYQLLFETGRQAKLILNEQAVILEANRMFGQITGRSDRGIDTSFTDYLEHSGREAFTQQYDAAFRNGTSFQYETELIPASDERISAEIHSEHFEMNGELFTFLYIRDVTEHMRNQKRLYNLAYKDSLTGLDNRWSFLDKLQTHISDLNRHSVVMLLDLDQFKLINDTLGHYAGDVLLQHAAQTLNRVMPPNTAVARLGGDEFAVHVLAEMDHSAAAALAEQVIDAFKKPIHLYGKPYKVTVSIGICLLPSDGMDSEVVLRNADAAMYSAKNNGRNGYAFFSPGFSTMSQMQLRMVNGLSDALHNNEFSLFYQPQINLRTGEVYGVEALLRWHSSELGPVSPGVFIPLAEQSGWIVPIGQWVLRTAIGQARRWIDAGYTELVVSVNLSAHQLRVPNIVEQVSALLQEYGVPASNLCLEITETTAISDIDTSLRVCSQFVDLGLTLAIDDFGVGYSSISMLNRFPFQFIKIDRSLIQGIVESDRKLAIIRTVVELSQHLGKLVVAEGVETEEQVKLLHELGCQEAQGYWFGKPLDVRAMNMYLADRKQQEQIH